jgi:hypothetical protein
MRMAAIIGDALGGRQTMSDTCDAREGLQITTWAKRGPAP